MNYSYKRYWEPSTGQVIGSTLAVGTLATAVSYPFEFLKTRIICRAEGIGIRDRSIAAGYNPWKIMREIHESGRGFKALYEGIDSQLAARLTYLMVRNVLYKLIYDQVKPIKPFNDLSHREKAVIAGFAGAAGALASNPFELINTRIIADGAIYQPHRRNLPGMFLAYQQYSSGGTQTLMRGGLANVYRAVSINVTMTGCYDYLNEKMTTTFGDAYLFNLNISLIWASFWGTAASHPFDIIRVRRMKQFYSDPSKNRITYNGFVHCAQQIIANEGILGFTPGFMTSFFKVWSYGWVTVALMDHLTNHWKRGAGLKEWEI